MTWRRVCQKVLDDSILRMTQQLCVRVRACACVCMCVCVRVWGAAGLCACIAACACVRMLVYARVRAHAHARIHPHQELYDKEDGQMWDMVTCMQYVDDVYISE